MEKVSEADLVKRVKAFILNDNYAGALAVVKGVDASRIKNPPILCLIGEVYMHEKQYEVAEEVFLRAYERSPKNRKILDLITSLYIEMGEYAEAEYYYKEFISVASRDLHRYILRYRLDKGKGERLSVLIDTLERLKDYEYIEEWAYELATLYEAAGEEKKCIHECDEIVLWFGHGEYVDKAIALKCKLTGEPLPKMTTVEMEMENNLRAEREARAAENAKEAAEKSLVQEAAGAPRASSTEFSDVDEVRVIDPDNALESAGVDTGIDTDMIQKAMENERATLARETPEVSNTGMLFGAMKNAVTSDELTEADLDDDDGDVTEADGGHTETDRPEAGEAESEAAGGDTEDTEAKTADVEADHAEAETADAEADHAEAEAAGAEADHAETEAAGAEADHTEAETADAKADHTEAKAADAEADRIETKPVSVVKNSVEEDIAQSQKLMSDLFKVPGLDKLRNVQRPQMPEFLKKESRDPDQDPIDELEALLEGIPDTDTAEEDLEDDEDEILSPEDARPEDLMSMFDDAADEAADDAADEVTDENAGAAAGEEPEASEDDFEMFGIPAYAQTSAQETQAHAAQPQEDTVDVPEESAAGGCPESGDDALTEDGADTVPESAADVQPERPAGMLTDDEDDGIEVEEALESMTEDQDEVLLEQAVFGGLPSADMLEDDLDAEDEYMDDAQVQVQISEADEQFLSELFSTGSPDPEDQDEVMDEDTAIPQTVRSIFATVPDVKNVHQQLAMTLSKFETVGQDFDVLAPYDINFVVLSDDKGMKSQIALGIAKALNTYGICDKNKIVRAKASELNRQDFSVVFGKISGGCLIIEKADELSDASVGIIEAFVNQENQDVAIVLESRQEALRAFWKKYPQLRGKFLNVINVSRYNEMELVTLAKGYIEKRGYELSPEAAIVLRDFFKKKNQKDQVFGYEDVMTVVDDGIANLDRRNMKNLFMTVLDNKYEEADMLKLLPEDFKGVL